jgi:putative nucleotidyltransferase with HDIG domain
LPHSLLATFVVMVMPSLVLTVLGPDGPAWLVVLSVLAAMAASVALAGAGSALWTRRPGSQDVVFGDLMLWGLLRRLRAERRLAEARRLLGEGTAAAGGQGLSREQLCETLQRLSALLEARDSYTHGHSRRVTRHSERIARELGLPTQQVAKVRLAAALHDVGKLHTPLSVLRKPDRLTDEEFDLIKRHPVDGASMVAEVEDPEVTAMVRHHHERLDGRGYPDGLSGTEIPLGARIIAVADTFDAITSSRPYRSATQHKKALDILSKEAGSQLDPDAVAAFKRYYSGRRWIAWSALIFEAPQRLGSALGGVFQGAAVAPLGQGAVATGLAALAGATVGGPAEPARAVADTKPAAVVREHTPRRAASADVDDPSTRVDEPRERSRRHDRSDARRRQRGGGRGGRKTDRVRPGGGGSGDGQNGGGETGGGGGGGPSDPGTPSNTGSPTPPAQDGGGSGGGGSGGGGGTTTPPSSGDSPVVQLPDVDVPQLPRVEVPSVETPEIVVPTPQLPGVQPPEIRVPPVRLPGVRLP